jgi:hypothetical protein
LEYRTARTELHRLSADVTSLAAANKRTVE